eukprot:752439-Prorocentrum_lima.AAC.1
MDTLCGHRCRWGHEQRCNDNGLEGVRDQPLQADRKRYPIECPWRQVTHESRAGNPNCLRRQRSDRQSSPPTHA